MLLLPNARHLALALLALLAAGTACSRGARRDAGDGDGDAPDATLTPAGSGEATTTGTTTGTTPRVWTDPPPTPLPPHPIAPEDAAPPAGPAPPDATITLQRTVCFGSCPAYTLELHGDGRVVFEGEDFVRVPKAERRIAPDVAQQIFASLARDGFWSWSPQYRLPITDMPTAIVTVRWGGRSKSVREYPPCDKGNGAPPELCILGNALDRVTRSDDWTKCKDSAGRATPCVQRKGGPDLKKDCDPPWFIDAQGVKHYKMQCLDP